MINTVNIKEQQLKYGYFKTGFGPENILILGSCRVVNYVNYFAEMPQFTVYSIDPFNWNWDRNDNRVDYMEALNSQESNQLLLTMLGSCKIFIHEYYANAGMFNCDKKAEKNIYQFGIFPDIDICIPNFNDLFILYGDIITFDAECRKMAIQDYNVIGKLSEQTIKKIDYIKISNINKFYDICDKSDIPQMGHYFAFNDITTRLYWNYNHVTKAFTLQIFKLINKKWFNNLLTVNEDHQDIFNNNYTFLTEYDNFRWPEQRKLLKEKL